MCNPNGVYPKCPKLARNSAAPQQQLAATQPSDKRLSCTFRGSGCTRQLAATQICRPSKQNEHTHTHTSNSASATHCSSRLRRNTFILWKAQPFRVDQGQPRLRAAFLYMQKKAGCQHNWRARTHRTNSMPWALESRLPAQLARSLHAPRKKQAHPQGSNTCSRRTSSGGDRSATGTH